MINPKNPEEKTLTGISGNCSLSTKKNIVKTSPNPLKSRENKKIKSDKINCEAFLLAPGNTSNWLQKKAKTFAKSQAMLVEKTVDKLKNLVKKAYNNVFNRAAITP